MWEAVETKAEKIKMSKTKERRSKRRSRKEIKRKEGEIEKETKKGKNNRSEESGGRIEDLE